jgi:hypothetical protein
MSTSGGSGALKPGAIIAVDVPVVGQEVQTASATVDVVVYADSTADVLNQKVFEVIVSQRKGRMLGLQKANELLQNALADPNDAHPSVTVVAKLKALAKQNENDESVGLLDAATSISNAPKFATGRSRKEDDYLQALIKRHQDRISLMLPHTQLTGVRP